MQMTVHVGFTGQCEAAFKLYEAPKMLSASFTSSRVAAGS